MRVRTPVDCRERRRPKQSAGGKVDPSMLPDTVVVYLDSTVAMPILTSYALARKRRRRLKRLYDRRDEAMALLKREYEKARKRSR